MIKEWIGVDWATDINQIFTQSKGFCEIIHVMSTNGARRFTHWSSVHKCRVCDAWPNTDTPAHITGGFSSISDSRCVCFIIPQLWPFGIKLSRYDFHTLRRVLGLLSNFNNCFQQSGNTLTAGIHCIISVSSFTTLEFRKKRAEWK